MVDGQRIKKVVYPPGDVLVSIEEESGQIFVQAMMDNPPETTISIITNSGFVQDLELEFTEKPTEIVILKEKSVEESVCLSDLNAIECREEIDSIQDAIEALLIGETPEEYIPVEDRQICGRVKRGVILRSVMRLVSPLYTIYVMNVENTGRNRECIHEKEINCVNGEWVFIERGELESADKMLALIGVKTYAQ
jgi:hypothetical protein